MELKQISRELKQVVLWLDDKFPLIGHPLIKTLRFIRFAIWDTLWSFKTRLKYDLKSLNLDINKIYRVDLQKIEYYSGKIFDPWKDQGKIIDGNWDRGGERFEDTDIFQAFKQRFKEGKKWEETNFYHRILKKILAGDREQWRCKDKKEWDRRLKKIENLYYQIKKEGYKSAQEIKQDTYYAWQDRDPRHSKEEIAVNIGREGQLLFDDGIHRLAIAKLLNIQKIPVNIIIRHKKWVDFRKELLIYAYNQGGKLYQLITHPDLQDIPYHYGEHRFNLIKKNLLVSSGKLLDIGANLGYFCHKFEVEGFDCYAVEVNPRDLYFLRKLKKIENRKFKIISESVFEYNKNQELKFDVVLALNIFHHFLKRKSTYEDFIRLLMRIDTKELFFETHRPEEEQMRKAYRNYPPEDFVDFMLKYSRLDKAKFIGEVEEGRRLYKLYKSC